MVTVLLPFFLKALVSPSVKRRFWKYVDEAREITRFLLGLNLGEMRVRHSGLRERRPSLMLRGFRQWRVRQRHVMALITIPWRVGGNRPLALKFLS